MTDQLRGAGFDAVLVSRLVTLRGAPIGEVRRLGGAPVETPGLVRSRGDRRAARAGRPGPRPETAMPSIKVLPADASARIGYDLIQESFGTGAPGPRAVVVDKKQAKTASAVLSCPGHCHPNKGIVLGVAVLLDAFLVRLVLPVLLRLTGRAGWWALHG